MWVLNKQQESAVQATEMKGLNSTRIVEKRRLDRVRNVKIRDQNGLMEKVQKSQLRWRDASWQRWVQREYYGEFMKQRWKEVEEKDDHKKEGVTILKQ